ncbi:uncharacterized protein LOC114532553 isoform X2 [Dendronephthya gigantea]|uniref:uncharacterized protein LOC114532553 isoform X2 n=1 Tax=Dendronephthya gigantea TaxID=151771 RepID=UPI00106DB628|nr:uncharacterized protein LOC114532553 isoform X2 [Dendronephthya gigantea]
MADEDIEEIADKFAGKFDVMTCSTAWDRSVLAERELKISQAVCLLWQNSTTGEVAGRHSDLHLLVCVYCAGLLDLLIMEKIRINDMLSTCLCLVSKKKMVEIDHNQGTSTYLDSLGLTEIMDQRDNPRELVDWLEESVDKDDDKNASYVTLESLVKGGFFRKEKLSVGTRFYLNNQEIKQSLVQDMRDSLLTEKTPDLYMRVILTLLQGADHYRDNYDKDKIFKQYFSKPEYKQAKARLKIISRDWPPIPPPPPAPATTTTTA